MKLFPIFFGCIIVFNSICIFSTYGTCEPFTPHHFIVGPNDTYNFTKIQDAIDNATDNDLILVKNGTYHENLVIEQSIRLLGESKNTTIIDGERNTSVITILSDSVTISGFTIRNSGNIFPYAGISIQSNNNIIVNNSLYNNFYGMVLLSASLNFITDNHIYNNHQCGIYFSGSTQNQLFGNVVENQPFNGFGLYDFSNSNTIAANTLMYNRLTGVNVRDSYNNSINDNRFVGNHIGLHIPPPQFGTHVSNNAFIGNGLMLDEEKDFIIIAWMAFIILAILGYTVLKKFFF